MRDDLQRLKDLPPAPPDKPIGSAPWTEPQKWLGFFFGALLVVIIAGELIG